MNVGKPRHRVDVSYELVQIADEDERAGDVLATAGFYRNASYCYIQAMEKRVRSRAFEMVDPYNRHWRMTNQHHDLCSSISFLLEVLGMETMVAKQVSDMLDRYVIGDVDFRVLHNSLRYPYFSEKHNSYSCVDYGEADCNMVRSKLTFLKNLLRDLTLYR